MSDEASGAETAACIAGFGFSTRAGPESLSAAYAAAVTAGGRRVVALATLSDKAEQLAPLARRLGVPLIGVPPGPLPPTVSESAVSRAARGTGSVAEACALAAAGAGAILLVPRRMSPDRLATCALAVAAGTDFEGERA